MKKLFSFLVLLPLLVFAQQSPDYIRHPTSVCTSSQYLQYTATSGTPATCKQVAYSEITGTAPSAGTIWQYKAKTTATSGYPGDGYVLWNNATQTSATNLLFSHLTTDNLDVDLLWSFVTSGGSLVLQDANASANYQEWTISGSLTNTNPGTSTSYWTVPVTLVASGGTGTTGFSNNHQLVTIRPGSSGLVAQANSTILSNISGGSAIPTANTITAVLDYQLGSTRGSTPERGASGWTSVPPGASGYAWISNGAGADPSWQPIGSVTSQWATALDCQFDLESSQTLNSNTTYTICGITWTKVNSANDSVSMAVTNGTGLVMQPNTTGTYSDTTRTTPYIKTDLTTLIPNFYVAMPIQVWLYNSADNLTNATDAVGFAIDNMSASDATMDQTVAQRRIGNPTGTQKSLRAGAGLAAAVVNNDTAALIDNTDRVIMVSYQNGRLNGNGAWFKGQYSSGWPALGALIPYARTTSSSTTYNTSADVVTGLTRQLVIFSNSGTSAKSYTVKRVMVQYMVR